MRTTLIRKTTPIRRTMKIKNLVATIVFILCSTQIQAAQQTVTVGTSGSKASLDTNFTNIQANFTETYTILDAGAVIGGAVRYIDGISPSLAA